MDTSDYACDGNGTTGLSVLCVRDLPAVLPPQEETAMSSFNMQVVVRGAKQGGDMLPHSQCAQGTLYMCR